MRQLTFILTIIVSTTFLACGQTNLNNDETFVWTETYGLGGILHLKKDMTFKYAWHTGLLEGVTLGTWTTYNDSIILNSEKQPSEHDFQIQRQEFKSSDSLTILLTDLYNNNLAFAECLMISESTESNKISTDIHGYLTFKKEFTDSLIIKYPGYRTVKLAINSTNSFLHLNLIETIDFYKYFTNQTLMRNAKGLYGEFRDYSGEIERRQFNKIKNAP